MTIELHYANTGSRPLSDEQARPGGIFYKDFMCELAEPKIAAA